MIFILLLSKSSLSGTEAELKILKVGAWTQGSSTFYIKVDRSVGPDACRSNLVKVDLGSDDDSQSKLISKNMVRSMALAGLVSNVDVELLVSDSCLYNNPTITQIWLSR